MKIAHVSDVHWRGLSRHSEYTKGFETLFLKLRAIKPDAIFLGGDYFHTKTAGLSPEVIDRLAWMFKGFGDIAPTHMILGNHDGNLSNESREDAISPIVKAMNNTRVQLYKESGNKPLYVVQPKCLNSPGDEHQDIFSPHNWPGCGTPVVLGTFSCFDKPGWNKVSLVPKAINIAAFHGSVGGSKMDNGWVMPDAKAEVQLSMFEGYDFVLLGDIHTRQFLAERPDKNGVMKPYVAYPGSTIQQNFGEGETKGFLVWDIRAKDDWDVEFVEVENYQPFITFPWKDTVEGTLEALQSTRTLLPGSRYRVTSKTPVSPIHVRQLSHELKTTHKGEDVIFKAENSLNYDTIIAGGVAVKKTSLRNDRNVIHGFYKQFLDMNVKKFSFSEDQVNEALGVIDQYMDKLSATELETTRDVNWSIKSFEFDNLYRYGSGNKLDFEKLNGVVGVFGKNKMGKSSLVGALMYLLFNGSDRDGVTKNGQVMNQTKKTCSAKAIINVNGVDYLIERSSTRAEAPKRGKKAKEEFDLEKTETKLHFAQINADGSQKPLNGTTRDETDKEIRKLLGNVQDFLMTSVATQRRMESFIDEGATARKTILNRFLDLDIFEKLYGFAKEDVTALNAKTATYSMGWEQSIAQHAALILKSEEEVSGLDTFLGQLRENLDGLRIWIAQNEAGDAAEATANLLKVQQKIFSLNRQKEKAEGDYSQLQDALEKLKKELERLQVRETQIDVKELVQRLNAMKAIQLQLQTLTSKVREEERNVQAQEKSIRKLEVVPCGDQYPTCLYIKDSHEDKATIAATKKELADLVERMNQCSEQLKELEHQRVAEQMAEHVKIQQDIKELAKEKVEKEARLVLLEKSRKDIAQWLLSAKQDEESFAALAATQEDVEVLEKKKAELKAVQNTAYSQERRRSDLLIQIGREKAALEQIQKDQLECEQLLGKLKVLESVQGAFHKNGIPAIVLKTQLPAINAELSKLLGGLVDFNITFETEAGSNVMDVYIEDGHSRRILELGSGMEKMLASIAIRVALVNLSSLPKSDIFVIDEGFNALDDEHVGKCLELLQTLKNYFRSVLVISHMQRVKEAADTIVEVVSVGLDSRIEA